MDNNEQTRPLSFKDIFEIFSLTNESSENIRISKIIIPKIQRDYAHGRQNTEAKKIRENILNDIKNAIISTSQDTILTLDFVYGDIKKVNSEYILTPLDGQQRLTTLFLLYWYAIKKECIKDFDLKNKFSYETRPSAMDFCSFLTSENLIIDFAKDKVSESIKDNIDFPLSWQDDPTVESMLFMLDEIHKKFKDLDNNISMYERLNNTVKFFFLPIKNMGDINKLYINMNSRGKPLSDFENVKAELKKLLDKNKQLQVENFSKNLMNSFDGAWTDAMWEFCENEPDKADDNFTNKIDDAFINYINFICELLCYTNIDLPIKERIPKEKHKTLTNPVDLVDFYFDEGEKQKDNIEFLQKYFEYLTKMQNGKYCIKTLMEEAFYKGDYNNDSKVKLFTKDNLLDLSNINKNHTNFILFYAIIEAIKQNISLEDFKRRFRIINNLVQHSTDEINVRASNNTRPAILKQVEHIIKTGRITNNIKIIVKEKDDNGEAITKEYDRNLSFNAKQIEEETAKIEFLNNEENKQYKDMLYRLEDHDMLKGKISVVGLEHPEYFEKFLKIFNVVENWETRWREIDCALMVIGDTKYCVEDGTNNRYQLGSQNIESWYNLFERFNFDHANRDSADLKSIVEKLLSSGDSLKSIKENYINDCKKNQQYDFRYYYVEYDSFAPKKYGKYYWVNSDDDFDIYVMETREKRSTETKQPFLIEASKNKSLKIEPKSTGIVALPFGKDKEVICVKEGFIIRPLNSEDETQEKLLKVERDYNDKYDLEDRIEKLGKALENPEAVWDSLDYRKVNAETDNSKT